MKKKRIPFFILLLGYTLGAWKGYVALWKDHSPTPVQIFPYSIASLPPADQQALTRGIEAESEAALQRLLEDHLS